MPRLSSASWGRFYEQAGQVCSGDWAADRRHQFNAPVFVWEVWPWRVWLGGIVSREKPGPPHRRRNPAGPVLVASATVVRLGSLTQVEEEGAMVTQERLPLPGAGQQA